MFFTSPKSNSFLKSRDCADGTLSQRRDEQTTYFSCKSYLIFWATNTQEDKNTRSACREYLPINMFNVGEFQSQFVSKHGSKDDFSEKVFIRFVFLLIAVSGVFRVPLLRQESQRTFIFSRKRELIWGWKFVYAASFFSFWKVHTKKLRGDVQYLNLDALWWQVSPQIVLQNLQRVVFSMGQKITVTEFFGWIFMCEILTSYEIKCPICSICLEHNQNRWIGFPQTCYLLNIENWKLKT